jgi:mRNA interferase RelE/StbE
MAWQVIYAQKALAELHDLPKPIAQRIAKKIKFFSEQKNPLAFAKRLTNFSYGSYRFRVGDYRIIFDVDKKGKITILLILNIKHRREVYNL